MTLKNGKETEKQQEKNLENLLPERTKEELKEILAIGENINLNEMNGKENSGTEMYVGLNYDDDYNE